MLSVGTERNYTKSMKYKELTKKYPFLITWISAAWNLVYGIFLAFAGILQRSYWYITLAAYFLVLGVSRVMVSAFKEINEKKTMKRLGFVFLFLAVVISGMILLCIREGRNPSRTMISAIAQATYAFVLIGIAIFNIIRSHRRKDDRMIMIRSISMASAIGSMLSLERVMLGTFSQAATQFTVMMEAYSGFGAFAIIVLLGIHLIRRSRKTSKTEAN